MTSVTDVATQLKAILAVLADVDESSLSSYTPAIKTQKIALLIVPFEQSGMMSYAGTGKHSLVHAHRISCEFWVKVDTGNVAAAVERGRDICLQAMRLIAANPTLNGSVLQVGSSLLGNQGRIGEYNILPRYEERGQIPYIIARLFVPVELRETAAW